MTSWFTKKPAVTAKAPAPAPKQPMQPQKPSFQPPKPTVSPAPAPATPANAAAKPAASMGGFGDDGGDGFGAMFAGLAIKAPMPTQQGPAVNNRKPSAGAGPGAGAGVGAGSQPASTRVTRDSTSFGGSSEGPSLLSMISQGQPEEGSSFGFISGGDEPQLGGTEAVPANGGDGSAFSFFGGESSDPLVTLEGPIESLSSVEVNPSSSFAPEQSQGSLQVPSASQPGLHTPQDRSPHISQPSLSFDGLNVASSASNADPFGSQRGSMDAGLDFGGLAIKGPAASSIHVESVQPPSYGSSASASFTSSFSTLAASQPTKYTPQHSPRGSQGAAAPVPVQAPPAAKVEPKDNTAKATQDVDDALLTYWKASAKAAQTRAQARIAEQTSHREATALRNQLKEAEATQAACIESEDFDRADQINHNIESLKAALDKLSNQGGSTASKQGEQDRQTQFLQSLTDATLRTLTHSLKAFDQHYSTQEGELAAYARVEQLKLEKQEELLSAEGDRLKRSGARLDDELQEANREEERLEGVIRTECAEPLAERDRLAEQDSVLNKELEALRAQVLAKEKEVEQVKAKLAQTDDKINQIRSGYDRKLKREAESKQALLQEKARVEEENQTLQRQRVQLESEVAAKREKETGWKARIKAIKANSKLAQRLVVRLQWEQEQRTKRTAALGEREKKLSALREQVASCQKTAEAMRSRVGDLQSKEAAHHNNIMQIDLKIPGLNAEKKVAVTARNFKVAGNLSKDIKTLEESRKASEDEISNLKFQVVEISRELQDKAAETQRVQQLLSEEEASRDLDSLQALLDRAKYLQAMLKELDRTGTKGKSYEKSLEDELRAVEGEAEALRAAHGWPVDKLQGTEASLPKMEDSDEEFPESQQEKKAQEEPVKPQESSSLAPKEPRHTPVKSQELADTHTHTQQPSEVQEPVAQSGISSNSQQQELASGSEVNADVAPQVSTDPETVESSSVVDAEPVETSQPTSEQQQQELDAEKTQQDEQLLQSLRKEYAQLTVDIEKLDAMIEEAASQDKFEEAAVHNETIELKRSRQQEIQDLCRNKGLALE